MFGNLVSIGSLLISLVVHLLELCVELFFRLRLKTVGLIGSIGCIVGLIVVQPGSPVSSSSLIAINIFVSSIVIIDRFCPSLL